MWPFKKKNKSDVDGVEVINLNIVDGYNLEITLDNLDNTSIFNYSYTEKLKEISSFIIFYSAITKKLLESKGFPINDSDGLIYERIALLHSEVSELVDAEKKGKEVKEKQDELADIIIRLMNIPLMFDGILDHIKNLSESDDYSNMRAKVSIHRRLDLFNFKKSLPDEDDIEIKNNASKECKLIIINRLHQEVSNLQNYLFSYKNSRFSENFIYYSVNSILDIILLCYLYIEISPEIHGNLHEFVDSKMKENFKRPYRFNTSSNF